MSTIDDSLPYWEDACDTCGNLAVSATRGIPQHRYCSNGHDWVRPNKSMQSAQQVSPTKATILEIRVKLMQASLSACSCLTKTPVHIYHNESCRYRLIQEALTLVISLDK